MTETSHQHNSNLNYSLVSSANVLDGIQISSVIVPTGLIINRVRNALKPTAVPVSSSAQVNSTISSGSLSLKPSSLNHQLTSFLKLNGIWTFGLGLAYAAAMTSISLLAQDLKSAPKSNKFKSNNKSFKSRSNDYSIIGGTLGGLITTTIFWNRSFINLIKIIPGGIGIGVASGISTAYAQAIGATIDEGKQPLNNVSS